VKQAIQLSILDVQNQRQQGGEEGDLPPPHQVEQQSGHAPERFPTTDGLIDSSLPLQDVEDDDDELRIAVRLSLSDAGQNPAATLTSPAHPG
jgi:hypothetical protein